MIVVDANVLAYAVGRDHPLREPSRRAVEAVAARRVDATTTAEVIQEFVHVRARRHGRTGAAQLGRQYAALFAPLLPSGAEALDAALRLHDRHERLGAFDALLAATAIRAKATALVSADVGFTGIRGLRHVAPGTAEFDALFPSD